ncbi:protein of unknown function DUF116 [Syntrophotalea carbinolica DSM 2380]|uniref:DUF116 domain-containing protein n=1 Tax=Syntrophotalea carbinolica (strain DSM 2380 / NBRC 103641 / GraBd1) TaxID=338963 RepID=Q3A7Y8_SYNC1|nr:DUF116 domain-containing protein [Syntrophotalea carbinolica]ABA87504.1 protein of unknown function DUF116 [Syntrophotalea carbinolica DSM 2380]
MACRKTADKTCDHTCGEVCNNAEQSTAKQQRPFLILLALVGSLFSAGAFVVWWLPSVGLSSIHPRLPYWFGLAILALVAVVIGGLGLLALTLITGRDLFIFPQLRGLAIRYLMPAVIGIGAFLRLDRDALQRCFIHLNNQLVHSRNLRVPAAKAMILLPHCLQLFDCAIKVTGDVEQCARCGRCDIGDLAELAKQRGVTLAVATGGTLARKLLMEKRPRLVVAVACERDLTSGIRDAYPLPVVGVFNTRPEGPCFNTRIDIDAVQRALDAYVVSE